MAQSDDIKRVVQAVLEDGSNQHQYPYLLIPKVMKAIDESVARSQHAQREDAKVKPEPEAKVQAEKKANKGLEAARAAKEAKKKAKEAAGEIASSPAASSEEKVETTAEVKDEDNKTAE